MSENNIILVGFMGAGKSLQSRLKVSSHRPLGKAQPDWNALEALLLSRIPFYETADLIIDTSNKNPNEIAIEILFRLAEA